METVKLLRSQTLEASKTLSDAFSRDPVVGHFLTDNPAEKLGVLQAIAEKIIRYCEPHNHIYTTSDSVKGIAMWLPPEAAGFSLTELWRLAASGALAIPFYMRWDRIVETMSFMIEEAMQRGQRQEPHWYLAMLGVGSEYQGQGIGGQLLQPILEQSDREKLPCYLETSTEGAVRFYQRQGFEILHIGKIGNQLPYWTMKRTPKAM
ncbi:GNAT family N-acetyltransferase [Leptolyngbya sp. AN03gr2]|uniref:GNAT family N-acetyltransferase n=1 Tax=unclassified Leptolyngbya TaxID=2650499 RepID=UPI003D31A599